MQTATFDTVLRDLQGYISSAYPAALLEEQKNIQLRAYIEKRLRDKDYAVEGMTFSEVAEKVYNEMAEYSVITPFLNREDVEEINVNCWNDIAITYSDGRIEKLQEHFRSAEHSVDIVKRLLHYSGMIIDNAIPTAQGHLPNNTRITVVKEPIVDEGRGVSVSIRLLHPNQITPKEIVNEDTATEKMVEFLCMCLRYGVSFVVAGVTSSGKTTLLNALLSTIPNNKRVFTIESGSRELSLVKTDKNGEIINNVIHTLSRPSENEKYNISQEDLVIASLRFNPDIIVVGEMRDTEAYTAVEASLTGHTVVSTVHALAADAAHIRLALLCKKKFDIDFDTSVSQAAMAFPIVIYIHKLEDNSRKIMDISECRIKADGRREYRKLFGYRIISNRIENGSLKINGSFEQVNTISEDLKNRLLQFGAPIDLLNKFTGEV